MTADANRSGGIAGLSVRTRITVAVALLTSLALAGAGLVVFVLEMARIDRATATAIQQETDEFLNLKSRGTDPATGRRFEGTEPLVRAYLGQNLVDDNELLVGWWDGEPRVKQGDRHTAILRSRELRSAVDARVERGGTTEIDTRFGDVSVTVQPVAGLQPPGAFVIVFFLSDARAELRRTLTTYFVVAVTSLGLITTVAAWQAGRLLRPLRTLRDEAQQITESDLSRRIPERGNDDITRLTRTFNEMLGRLQAAFAAQRTFLDEAGHELKTPLTVVRGHVELLESTDPEDVKETRELLLDETDRMARLVEDLIMLAKADRPDFLRPAEVSVERITAGALDKCRALGERAWVLDETASVSAHLDEQRITQALLQLAENAVKHTSVGDRIGIGSAVHGETLVLWVRDEGPGVPDDLKARVFDRFEQGPAGDDEGAGLGLSIVRAIALAHGGSVRVTDVVPSGARFEMTLPLRRTED